MSIRATSRKREAIRVEIRRETDFPFCGFFFFFDSPPFDASNQTELTRKIKAGNVPQLPRGFSLELGNLIRQMLDLNVSDSSHLFFL